MQRPPSGVARREPLPAATIGAMPRALLLVVSLSTVAILAVWGCAAPPPRPEGPPRPLWLSRFPDPRSWPDPVREASVPGCVFLKHEAKGGGGVVIHASERGTFVLTTVTVAASTASTGRRAWIQTPSPDGTTMVAHPVRAVHPDAVALERHRVRLGALWEGPPTYLDEVPDDAFAEMVHRVASLAQALWPRRLALLRLESDVDLPAVRLASPPDPGEGERIVGLLVGRGPSWVDLPGRMPSSPLTGLARPLSRELVGAGVFDRDRALRGIVTAAFDARPDRRPDGQPPTTMTHERDRRRALSRSGAELRRALEEGEARPDLERRFLAVAAVLQDVLGVGRERDEAFVLDAAGIRRWLEEVGYRDLVD